MLFLCIRDLEGHRHIAGYYGQIFLPQLVTLPYYTPQIWSPALIIPGTFLSCFSALALPDPVLVLVAVFVRLVPGTPVSDALFEPCPEAYLQPSGTTQFLFYLLHS